MQKKRPQLSSSRDDCIRLYCELKPLPISTSNRSLFNSNTGIRPRTVKRVVAFLDLEVIPRFSMTLFSSGVDQWEPCGCPHCSQVALENSTVQIPHTPALFMRGQERSTARLSSVPPLGYVTTTHQKYSGPNLKTHLRVRYASKYPHTYMSAEHPRSDRHHGKEVQACRPESCVLFAFLQYCVKSQNSTTRGSPSGDNQESCAVAQSQQQSDQAVVQT